MTCASMATETPATPTSASTKGAEVDSARSERPARGSRMGLTSPKIVATARKTVGHSGIWCAIAGHSVANNDPSHGHSAHSGDGPDVGVKSRRAHQEGAPRAALSRLGFRTHVHQS